MRTIYPPEVLYTPDVMDNPLSKKRMERMMECTVCDRVREVNDREVDELAERLRSEAVGKRTGEIGRDRDPTILFTNLKWPYDFEVASHIPWYLRTLKGLRWVDFRDSEKIQKNRGIVCQSGYELHSAYGCIQHCDYCFIGNTLMIGLNLEELLVHIDRLIDDNPWQTLFKFDNQTDNLCFEPEYGVSSLFVDYFAHKPGRYLMLYTKSDNVDHLLDLDHRGKTVVCWTLSCDKAASIYEKGAPTMENRIEAARKCQEAGYSVRFRFSPIIPIKNWERENGKMIERLFEKVKPGLICIETLTHMSVDQIRRSLDTSKMDEEILESMDENLSGDKCGPFPHAVREKIYRFFLEKVREVSPETPVVLCLETPEMWKSLGHMVRMDPENYVCCCGPDSSPDNPLFSTFMKDQGSRA